MADTLRLWCFLQGDTLPFSVKASGEELIDELNTVIHAKRFDVLQGIDAASLILYKVCRSSLWHLAYVLRIFP